MHRIRNAAYIFALTVSLKAETVFLTNTQNQLLRTDTSTLGTVMTVGAVSGLQSGESLLGIDFRPATGQLFGLGSTSRLYTIDTNTGAATAVGSAGAFTLSGTSFGFDFNPTVDRIRVVSNAGQDLRLNPNDGTLTSIDAALNGATSSITGSAYTNSFGGSTMTTLYGIDNVTGALYIQNPPNNGTLALIGFLGISGSIGPNVGFDIAYPSNIGYATLQTSAAGTGLYSINLGTGGASLLGNITGQNITGLAIASVPEPSSLLLIGLGIGSMAALRLKRRS